MQSRVNAEPTDLCGIYRPVSFEKTYTVVASNESIQTRRCNLPIQIPSYVKFKSMTCMKTFMLISIYLVFLGMRKRVDSMMMKTKKAIRKMKYELNGEITEEFVGSTAKMYSLKTKKEEMKKTIEVKKKVKKDNSHQDYVIVYLKKIYAYHADYSII